MLSVFFNYLIWHYTRAIVGLFRIYGNLFNFLVDFFSLPILVRSLFSPWRRLGEDYPKDMFALGQVVSVFIVNILMRFVGFLLRLFIIIFGVMALIVFLLTLPVVFIFWLIAPFVLIVFFILGIALLL